MEGGTDRVRERARMLSQHLQQLELGHPGLKPGAPSQSVLCSLSQRSQLPGASAGSRLRSRAAEIQTGPPLQQPNPGSLSETDLLLSA